MIQQHFLSLSNASIDWGICGMQLAYLQPPEHGIRAQMWQRNARGIIVLASILVLFAFSNLFQRPDLVGLRAEIVALRRDLQRLNQNDQEQRFSSLVDKDSDLVDEQTANSTTSVSSSNAPPAHFIRPSPIDLTAAVDNATGALNAPCPQLKVRNEGSANPFPAFESRNFIHTLNSEKCFVSRST